MDTYGGMIRSRMSSISLTNLVSKWHTSELSWWLLLKNFIPLYWPSYHWFWCFLILQGPLTQSITRLSCPLSLDLKSADYHHGRLFLPGGASWSGSTQALCQFFNRVAQGSKLSPLFRRVISSHITAIQQQCCTEAQHWHIVHLPSISGGHLTMDGSSSRMATIPATVHAIRQQTKIWSM